MSDPMKWFHGNLSREAADDLLKQGYEDGTFLVRESSTATGDFVLSLLCQEEVCHYQIRRHGGEDAFFSIDDKVQTKILHGLDTLVDYYQQAANGLPSKLTVPLIRDPPPHNTRSHGVTNLLHRATSKNESKVVFELLKCGYRNFDAKNQDGQTALHLAALNSDEDILKHLLNAKVQVNSSDSFGCQPLHYAARSKPASFIRTLISAQANVQGRNIENGYVPLHEAAKHGNLEAVQELLLAEAPPLPRTSSGEFPFDLAKEAGQTAVEEFLLGYKLPPANTTRDQWYHGTLTRDEAVAILKKHAKELVAKQSQIDTSGCFLVRYSESPAASGLVLTLLSDQVVKNFRISQADLYQNGVKLQSGGSKFLYIDDGPYWPSVEHLIAHFMRFSYGLPVSLKFAVPPQPKPEVPSFATIPRSSVRPKATSPATPPTPVSPHPLHPHPHVPALTIAKKKQKENSSSMFNTLRITSPKKALFDMNSLRKSKSKGKRSESESSVSGSLARTEQELQAAAPMLKSLSFSTEFSTFNADSGAVAGVSGEVYNVPRNNTPIEIDLPPIAQKTAAEVEYFTKSDIAIERERAGQWSANGYQPTVDVLTLLDQQIKAPAVTRINSIASTASTESEMAGYLHRKCSGTPNTLNSTALEAAKLRFFIDPENLMLDSEIGNGEFGSVHSGWLVRKSSSGEESRVEVAIKMLSDEHSNKQEFLREASVMMRLEHKCIVRLIGISKGEMLMMVQELAPLGSMLQYIQDHGSQITANSELKVWASQIACGMHYLESQHFVHRDLAARNILLTARHQAKISDFGMSRSLRPGSTEYQFTQGGRWPIRWYAPESFNLGIFSHASDVWSFGVTIWEMFSLGAPPYGEISNVDAIKLVDSGERLPQPNLCPAYIYAVMQSCWKERPKDRPTFVYLTEFFARDPDYQNLPELVQTVHI
ncbi:tyrosine-protein kinase Shark isoform X2 [Drosophila rhopaloa]|uniref:Tyrosine-protein kinase n=1 Tax=Drosophila rhopaloa TaxID=1041015 RepID=A0A6P4FL57_DRORH|nr:tyrosine-protein kinase Shark isoform X2 [Drosophila rhopaloa]